MSEKRRKLFFISHRDMRKNRADCVHIMRICREYSKNGFDVTLVTPRTIRFEYKKKKSDIWKIHKVEETFRVIELPTFLFDNMPRVFLNYSRFMRFMNFGIYFLFQIIFGGIKFNDVIYAGDHMSLIPIIFFRNIGILKSKIFLDKGETIDDKIRHYVVKNIDGLIAINKFIYVECIRIYGLTENKVYRRSFPSMIEDFIAYNKKTREEYRDELGIPRDDKIVVYSGKIAPHLVEIKLLIETAKLLRQDNIKFYFVGIRDINKDYFNDLIKENKLFNVKFIDFQPVESFIKYVKIADILVSYYDGNDYYSAYMRVPAKSSMYLSSNIPSIYADVPSLREWFTDDMVYFVKPNNPELLYEQIIHIFINPIEANIKALNSLKFAEENNYAKSYGGVSEFIKSI